MQLGAGVGVPVRSTTVFHMNGEVDLRSGSKSWNVGAGGKRRVLISLAPE